MGPTHRIEKELSITDLYFFSPNMWEPNFPEVGKNWNVPKRIQDIDNHVADYDIFWMKREKRMIQSGSVTD